ncbi:MAG: branched-chain amino acid ABC transporter substrate-binding protein [Microbacteriaceae bacterium]|nr:MAG: branched-chain amino acid ABC transporter substrate-binding protein [Microbacteriaceae bacterium]
MIHLNKLSRFCCAATIAALSICTAPAALAQVKIAVIDPMSGPFANFGENSLKHLQAAVDAINAKGGVLGGQKLEIVPIDGKGSAQDSVSALQSAMGQGIRFVVSSGSNVVTALVNAANKTAERDPGKSFLVLNYAAADPDETNSACSFWNFRFYPDSDMQMNALTDVLAADKAVKKVYIIGADYSFGHQVSRAAKEMIAKKRPDVHIVGDAMHPYGTVKDFAPYVTRIKESGADTVITGNFGNDLVLLIRAAKDIGLNVKFYTYFGGNLGVPDAIGTAGIDRVITLSGWHPNVGNNKTHAYAVDFKKKYGADFFYLRMNTMMDMLAKAIDDAHSADPVKVGRALEGMNIVSDTGEVHMRKINHQLLMPMYVWSYAKLDGKKVKYQLEGSGVGTKTLLMVSAKQSEMPTTCKMQRP